MCCFSVEVMNKSSPVLFLLTKMEISVNGKIMNLLTGTEKKTEKCLKTETKGNEMETEKL